MIAFASWTSTRTTRHRPPSRYDARIREARAAGFLDVTDRRSPALESRWDADCRAGRRPVARLFRAGRDQTAISIDLRPRGYASAHALRDLARICTVATGGARTWVACAAELDVEVPSPLARVVASALLAAIADHEPLADGLPIPVLGEHMRAAG